jgi:hypothetical protein
MTSIGAFVWDEKTHQFPHQPRSKKNWLTHVPSLLSNWERSGNGNGNRADDENLEDGDVRLQDNDWRNFLGMYKPHLLYFWQKLEGGEILQHTLSMIPKEVSATSEGVPSCLTTPTIKKRKADQLDVAQMSTINFQSDIWKSLTELARTT